MAGIAVLIFGTSYTVSYYIFQCRENLFYFYLYVYIITCGTSFIITMIPSMHRPENKSLKGIIFLTTGVLCGLSLLHAMYIGYKR